MKGKTFTIIYTIDAEEIRFYHKKPQQQVKLSRLRGQTEILLEKLFKRADVLCEAGKTMGNYLKGFVQG